jgi:hypothetical protein
MTDLPPTTAPSEPQPQPGVDGHEGDETTLPRWVPVLIGAILVTMAALAVFTGLRYRNNNTLVSIVHSPQRAQQPATAAPPGEPEPGASLIFPGASGDNAPAAHPPVGGQARAVVTGSGETISATVRIWARRGMQLNVVPDDAVVYVNEIAVGQARQFNGPDEVYDFPAAGSYTVKLTAPGYKDRSYTITASDTAKAEIALIDAKLEKQ